MTAPSTETSEEEPMPYEIVDVSEIESPNGVFKPLRPSLGVSAFGINQLELPANAEGPVHDHGEDGQEEVYAIVRGGGAIRVEGQERDLHPGQFVFLAPGTSRQMVRPGRARVDRHRLPARRVQGAVGVFAACSS